MSNYLFAATRGKQGGREYYVIQCPIRLLSKIILFDESELPKNIRAERSIDETQVEIITKYLIAKIDNILLPPFLATINQPIIFEEISSSGEGFGRLLIPMSAMIVLNFGQNYRAALIEVLQQHPEIANDTVPIMLFADEDFLNTPQIFSNLNTKITSSYKKSAFLSTKGNHLEYLVKELIKEVSLFAGLTEIEKTTLSNRSNKLFTLSSIYQANQALLGATKRTELTAQHKELAIQYWNALSQIIPEWEQAIRREVRTSELRNNYIHAHGMALISLGNLGCKLIEQYPDDWQKHLKKLERVDWKRTNTEWQKRAMNHGRMSKTRHSIVLTTNYLRMLLNLPLTLEEEKYEAELIG
ncbi:MAG: DGQHR domain-containing protein [Chloroflexi bacterium]|uniref:DGQHR domain-containing protein n=1 Tax=Candidatus Chlorohelix allophototropha TaxID=3003348 RepID=A0A8T7M4E8_9CHLR|nr:DGQHR domain-containing protein [Chloroflexota bacterium]WJW70067.1 DNA sulfur modification protein DndB [Chloroflexota bacterium L227-S17]